MKLPAIQFYPADWRKDPGVQSLDFFDKGVWFEILCLMHESPERGKLLLNGIAMPDAALARILGLDNQTLTKTLTTLLDYGVASRDPESGALMNRRMVKDEGIRKVRTEAGKKGGNPALLNQKPTTPDKQKTTTRVKQIPTPSSSSSTSSSTTVTSKPRDARLDHPALIAVREVKGKFPNRDVWDLVIKTVGDKPDIPKMKDCWTRWRAKNYAPENLGWLVDWYAGGNGAKPSPGMKSADLDRLGV
jgi:hypothetical protein